MKKLDFDKIVWICAGVFLAIVLSITFLSNDAHKGAGIDIYLAPEKSIFGGMITRDYSRIQSEKQTYSIDEKIVLDASCGFYLPEKARYGGKLCFDIACVEYMDVSISVGSLDEYPGTGEEFVDNAHFGGISSAFGHNLYYLETKDADFSKLILKRGFFGQINKNSLQYHFTVTVQVKPDAPDRFSGSIYIRVYDDRGGNSYIRVIVNKDGNTVHLRNY